MVGRAKELERHRAVFKEDPSMTATDYVVEMVIWLVCGFGLVGPALVGGLVPLHPAPV